jgi:hypothetical protein
MLGGTTQLSLATADYESRSVAVGTHVLPDGR